MEVVGIRLEENFQSGRAAGQDKQAVSKPTGMIVGPKAGQQMSLGRPPWASVVCADTGSDPAELV